MTVNEKVAYLKGSADLGMDYNSKIMKAVIDAMEEMAAKITELEETVAELCEQVDLIDEDLDSLEEDYYDDSEEECGCFEDEDDVFFELNCPACGDTICVYEEMLEEGTITCPNCKEDIEVEFEDEDEDEIDAKDEE